MWCTSFFASLNRSAGPGPDQPERKSRRRPFKRRRLAFDGLEDRRLLSAGTVAPSGPEFMVNTTTTGEQQTQPFYLAGSIGRAVAMDGNGNSVAVWASQQFNSSGQYTGNWNVMFQLYTKTYDSTISNYDLQKEGGETTVATSSRPSYSGYSNGPIVMVARAPTSGDFSVVWETDSLNKFGSNVRSTHAELFSANGTSLTAAMLVGGSGDNTPRSVAMDDNGFDVLYDTPNSNGLPVYGVQRYSSSGAAEGRPISVAKTTGGDFFASIAMDATGDFVVDWDNVTGTSPNWVYTINAQRYSSAGKAVGSAIQVNQDTTQEQTASDVGMDAAGDFVVTWNGVVQNVSGSNQSGGAIWVRTVSSSGVLGNQVEVVTPTAHLDSTLNQWVIDSSAGNPAVAVQPGGAFDLAYVFQSQTANDTTGQITSAANIDGDTFDAAGNSLQTAFQVNDTTTTNNGFPSAAVDGAGELVIVWNANLVGAVSGDTGDVFGQFYVDPPAPATTASSSAAPSSSSGGSSPGGSSTAASDAAWAAYEYPLVDDGTLVALARRRR